MLNVAVGVFIWLLGLCIGSFLNVVIYRLPLGLSVGKPTWSFCPRCNAGIPWFDNMPLLSWLVLRGRCRHCGAGISLQYPLVEAVTGLAFVLVFWLIFEVQARVGLSGLIVPSLATDAPLLLAWLVLAACLIGCSGMDIIAYVVDTRLVFLAVIVGIGAHALWPQPAFFFARAAEPLSAAATAAFLVSVVMLWLTPVEEPRVAQPALEEGGQSDERGEPSQAGEVKTPEGQDAPRLGTASGVGTDPQASEFVEPEPATVAAQHAADDEAKSSATSEAVSVLGPVAPGIDEVSGCEFSQTGDSVAEAATQPPSTWSFLLGSALILLLAGVSLLILASGTSAVRELGVTIEHLLWAGFGLIFILTSLAGAQQRMADEEIHALIEAERPRARWVTLRELGWLAPIVAAGALTWWWVDTTNSGRVFWEGLVAWRIGSFQPVAGAVFAMQGAIVAAALGWAVRIVFTLIFGREAFATGDIFILAAAGAAAGWDIGLLGFAMSVPVALAGWIVTLALKRTSMIPFGPWLTIGFLLALWWNKAAAQYATSFLDAARSAMGERPQVLLLSIALLLGALVIAVVVARLLRQVVEPQRNESG